MAAFNGKWKKVSCTNAEACAAQIEPASSAERKAELTKILSSLDQMEEFTVTGNKTNRKFYVGDKLVKERDNEFGVEQDKDSILGPSKTLLKLASPTRVESTIKTDKATGTIVLNIDGNKLVNELTVGGVTCVRTYEKV